MAPSDLTRRNARAWRSLVAAGHPDGAREVVRLMVSEAEVDAFWAEVVRQSLADPERAAMGLTQ